MGPVLGYLLDRFGPQGMIRLGIGIFALGFIGLSQIDSLGGFYVCAVLLAIGASLGGYFPLTVALIQWFERYRARALSLVSLGLALGGLLVPLVAWSMHHFGWRNTAMGSGVIALLVGLPLASVMALATAVVTSTSPKPSICAKALLVLATLVAVRVGAA